MNITDTVWRSLGQKKIHPSEVLNTLIELDNRQGQIGLWALENELRQKLPRLRPGAQGLGQAWLEAIAFYRQTYYPQDRLSKLFARLVSNPSQPLPKAS